MVPALVSSKVQITEYQALARFQIAAPCSLNQVSLFLGSEGIARHDGHEETRVIGSNSSRPLSLAQQPTGRILSHCRRNGTSV
jgi:hypothetical protein